MQAPIKKKLSFLQKIYFTSLIMAGVVFGLSYFLILPSISIIKQIGDSINEQRVDLEKKYRQGQDIRQLNAKLKSIQDKTSILDKVFLEKGRELDFVTDLEKLANNNNTHIKISLSEAVPASDMSCFIMPVKISASGGFPALLNFLSSLEKQDHYFNINSLDLVSAANSSPSNPGGGLTMNLSADVYWK